jgi:hypothetical protein
VSERKRRIAVAATGASSSSHFNACSIAARENVDQCLLAAMRKELPMFRADPKKDPTVLSFRSSRRAIWLMPHRSSGMENFNFLSFAESNPAAEDE